MAQIQQEFTMILEPKIVRINLKWGTEKFTDVPLDLNGPMDKFKHLLFELTGVPTHKQNIVYRGITWKPDQDLSKVQIKDGAQIMLIGSKEEIQIKQVIFQEDLTPQQLAAILKEKAGIVLPTGLINLGNTCYLNSSIQCLRRVKELREFVCANRRSGGGNTQFFSALRDLFLMLESKGQSVKPTQFLQVFFTHFPQFREMDAHQHLKQQDADECFSSILQTLEPQTYYENEQGEKRNLIQELFEIQTQVTMTNTDFPEEPTVGQDKFKKLMCIIDNDNNPVNTLVEGIKASLEENLQKTSSVDNQMHVYKKVVRINKLPNYLLVQLVRFYWRQGVNGREGTKSKILRNVAFPKVLDLYDFSTPELQQQLQPGRDYEKKQLLEGHKIEQDQFDQYKKAQEEKGVMIQDDSRQLYKKFKEQQKEDNIKKHDELLDRKHGFGLETGNYELISVLTHQGREADSGHYVAWVHESGDDWACYNDDLVSEVNTDKIMDLRGGGDWHMAYYLLYRKLEIE